MKPSQILREARARIPDEERWWRGGEPINGRHCAGTAINSLAQSNLADTRLSNEAIEAHRFLADQVDGHQVPQWNDDPQTSFEDMQLAFKLAIEAAEAVGR